LEPLIYDSSLPEFPSTSDAFQLIGYVDSAHGNDLCHRQSTAGNGFMLADGVIAYHCKTKSITATSSTEAEFIAAVSGGKVTKYIHSVMRQLAILTYITLRYKIGRRPAISFFTKSKELLSPVMPSPKVLVGASILVLLAVSWAISALGPHPDDY
jgi:hypothetical protein